MQLRVQDVTQTMIFLAEEVPSAEESCNARISACETRAPGRRSRICVSGKKPAEKRDQIWHHVFQCDCTVLQILTEAL